MSHAERQQRMNIRNAYLTTSLVELEHERDYRLERQDIISAKALQEMIDTCKEQGVDNFGKTY